jgi:hypothetical protein
VPFLKFSRDKRGYEHFSLVEPSAGRRGKSSRPRVLFLFRTPPEIKVGREPFTEEVRRAIEAQNPGLRFDWPRLLSTPIPAPDAEHWRERRRVERAARRAAREPEEADLGDSGDHLASGEPQPEERQDVLDGRDDLERKADADDRAINDQDDGQEDGQPEVEHVPAETTLSGSESEEPAPVFAPVPGSERQTAGRRRRRRGRRKRHRTVESPSGPAAPNAPVPPTEEV